MGAELPLLSLTGEGELVMSEAMVAEGAVVTTLTVDARALSILYMAGKGQGSRGGRKGGGSGQPGQQAPPPGPGRLIHKTSTTESQQAMDYQEQITQRPAWQVYQVG